jgi:undecaprenyl-diphosphatase
MLPITLCLVGLTWGIFEWVNARSNFADKDLDHQIVEILRQPDNPSRMIGPPQLEEAMRDFTALGGYAVLVTTFLGFSIFAVTELGARTFHFFWLTTVGGFWMGVLMKRLIQRERPSIVPHLSHVSGNTSFPSSHAMMSVVVYVTIGLLLSQLTSNRHLRQLMTGLPLTIAMIVGISRVCMGVHFPSDVMGGWTGGLLWTWVAFVIRGRLIGAREIDRGAVE